jgi:hypothetical protein
MKDAQQAYEKFAYEVKNKNRTFLSSSSLKFLEWIRNVTKKHVIDLDKNKKYYRARVCDDKNKQINKLGMKPIENLNSEGRANSLNINMLYLADDKDIAISESRAAIYENITVANFKLNRNLKIVDLSAERPGFDLYFNLPEHQDPDRELLVLLGHIFTNPLSVNDQRREYIPTQVIAEYFKSIALDGIAYQSQFKVRGIEELHRNIVLFNLEDADAVGYQIYQIKEITIQSQEISEYQSY